MKKSAIIIVFTFLIALGAAAWWWYGEPWAEKRKFYRFDKALWSASRPEERYYMARYLVDHGLLIGKTPGEIETMLGKAERGSGLYCLGPERGSYIRIDDDWLDLTFEDVGDRTQVANAYIRPD